MTSMIRVAGARGVLGGRELEATVSMSGAGAVRGAVAAVVIVLVVVTLPVALSGDASFAWVTLPFVALAGLLGAVCGTIAGRLLDSGRSWRTAAATSGAIAVVAVAAVMTLISDGQLANNFSGALLLAGLLAGGALAAAGWQSWAMARRQHRKQTVHRRTTV